MNIQVCRDSSDAAALYLPQRLYLKPTAKINVSVQLPPLKPHGKAVSNFEIMERLRKMIQPETFSVLKVSKNSSDVIRFDAEIDARDKLERAVSRLDDHTIKLTGYPDALKVRASEAKLDFPSRHAWDSFFRDAPNMDEMKPGERPDTIYVANLPIKWFVSHRERCDDDALPSESIFRKVFEKFGKVRCVDVPISDPFRKEMKPHMTGLQSPASDSQIYFEGYVQFSEYVGFVRAMDALKGKKLMRRGDDLSEWVSITVDFDKTKHMTDAAIKRRAIVRERLAERQRTREEKEKEEQDRVSKKEEKERQKVELAERQKLEQMREREERRKKKQLAKLMAKERGDIDSKVAEEERKLIKTQRKLQAIRLMEELFRRIELRPKSSMPSQARHSRYNNSSAQDASTRERIVRRYKSEQEAEMQKQRERLQKAYEGSIVLRAVLNTKKPRRRESSASSASSGRSEPARARHKAVKTEKLTSPERDPYGRPAPGAAVYPGMAAPYGYPYQFPSPAYPYHGAAPTAQSMQDMYYPMRTAYYGPPEGYAPRPPRFASRRPRGGRALYRGGPRMPYFDGPNANHEYYKYFKRLSESELANDHDDRDRDRRSWSRPRHHSSSRSRSRSRRRYSRSRTRSRSRSRSKSRRRRSYSRSRSRSRRRSRSRSRSRSRRSRSSPRRSRSRSRRSRSKHNSPSPKKAETEQSADKTADKEASPKFVSPTRMRRSKSWSLPKQAEKRKSWSKSPTKG